MYQMLIEADSGEERGVGLEALAVEEEAAAAVEAAVPAPGASLVVLLRHRRLMQRRTHGDCREACVGIASGPMTGKTDHAKMRLVCSAKRRII